MDSLKIKELSTGKKRDGDTAEDERIKNLVDVLRKLFGHQIRKIFFEPWIRLGEYNRYLE